MSKIAAVSVIVLVIFFVSSSAARQEPTVLPSNSLAESQPDYDPELGEEPELGCGSGEDACFMRKTLMAHRILDERSQKS
ncbi:hypothetical protein MKW94_014426 [Papaver nudicaule]|uniref:Phytosulfokine-beta n=1 Tax=Papaver nudicaule TaxID=74823 RepID=A0AA41S7V1_PAPNU|nr:hypothetical protein [Papaver nudicaule]